MARQYVWRAERGYVGVDLLPYQLALGVSVRLLDGLHVRVYVGPVKLLAGLHQRGVV